MISSKIMVMKIMIFLGGGGGGVNTGSVTIYKPRLFVYGKTQSVWIVQG